MISKPIKSSRRRQALIDEHVRRKTAAITRRANQHIIEVDLPPGRRLLFPFKYPPCPRCQSEHVIRGGMHRGEQRYRCLKCRRSFYGNVRLLICHHDVQLVCHRCGSPGTSRGSAQRPRSGLVGWCSVCSKRFTQGGPRQLDLGMAVLIERVHAQGAPPDVHEELFAQACLDVLEGFGYPWNVLLNVKAAFRRARGGWGLGSDHPEYRRQNGQQPYAEP